MFSANIFKFRQQRIWLIDCLTCQGYGKCCQDARSSQKRISYKPGLELLHYKFTLRADGVRVFLILPPEFQVCQRRSRATKFLPGTEWDRAVWEVEKWPFFFFKYRRLISPTLAPSLRSARDGHFQCTHGEWGIQPATPWKHIFKQERFS